MVRVVAAAVVVVVMVGVTVVAVEAVVVVVVAVVVGSSWGRLEGGKGVGLRGRTEGYGSRLLEELVEEMTEIRSSLRMSTSVFWARARAQAANWATLCRVVSMSELLIYRAFKHTLYINLAGLVKLRVGPTWHRSSQTCSWTLVGL